MLLSHSPLEVDRGSAIATARQFAADHGIDATSWSAYTTLDPSEKLMAYYHLHRNSGAAQAAQSFSLPITIRVLLVSGSNDSALVIVDQKGRVAGYDWTLVRSAKWGPPTDEAQSEAIASSVVARIPNLARLVALGKPEIATLEQAQERSCRKFIWHAQSAALPGLTFDIDTAVCGTQPVLETVSTNLDDGYVTAHGLGQNRSLQIVISVYAIYVAIVLIYSLYRYARRAFEGEVSHSRTLLLGAIVAAALLGSFLTAIDEYALGNYKANQSIPWYPLIGVTIAFGVMGLILAVTYEAGEGDLRELYPGKLTSLDALVRGKIFSRNVGQFRSSRRDIRRLDVDP